LLARSNQAEQAEQVLRQAIALDPNLSQAHYRLALLLKSTGRSQESKREMALFQQTKAAEDRQPKVTAFRKQTAQ
jgi:Tfp pilus assembly protein PilF